jgi:hypothetical protein
MVLSNKSKVALRLMDRRSRSSRRRMLLRLSGVLAAVSTSLTALVFTSPRRKLKLTSRVVPRRSS